MKPPAWATESVDGEQVAIGICYDPDNKRYLLTADGYKMGFDGILTAEKMRDMASALLKAADHAEMIEYGQRLAKEAGK